jgi:transposase
MASSRKASSKSSTRQRFDPEFKRSAVQLGKQLGIPRAASDLGVSEANLRNWTKAVDTQGSQAFLPAGQRTDVEAELRRVKEENRILKMERDILKKAASFFAKESS